MLGTTTTTDVAARVLAMDKGSDPTTNATKTNELIGYSSAWRPVGVQFPKLFGLAFLGFLWGIGGLGDVGHGLWYRCCLCWFRCRQ